MQKCFNFERKVCRGENSWLNFERVTCDFVSCLGGDRIGGRRGPPSVESQSVPLTSGSSQWLPVTK